jgi:hypothetical protein
MISAHWPFDSAEAESDFRDSFRERREARLAAEQLAAERARESERLAEEMHLAEVSAFLASPEYQEHMKAGGSSESYFAAFEKFKGRTKGPRVFGSASYLESIRALYDKSNEVR